MVDNESFLSLDEQLELMSSIDDVGFWKFDLREQKLDWNDAMFGIYGVNKATFTRKFEDWRNCLLKEDVASAEEAFNKSLETGKFNYRFRINHPKLGVRHIKATASAHKNDESKAEKVIGINIDVTEYIEKGEDALRASIHFKTFVEQSPNAIAMFNKNMEYITASNKWLKDYGLNTNIIGKSHYDIFPEIGDEWKEIHRKCLEGHIEVNDKASFTRKDGAIQYLRWHIRPWRFDNNEIGGVLMFTEDTTAIYRERVEREKLSSVLRNTQNIAQIGAWRVDLKKQKVNWDEVTKEIHEVSQDYVPTLEQGIEFFKEGFFREKITTLFNRAIEKKEPYDYQFQIVTAKGNVIWVRSIGKPVLSTKGEVIAISGLFQNIDEQKRREIDLEISRNQFEGAFENSAIGMALVSLEGKWLKVNKQCVKIFGFPEKELLTKSFQEISHENDVDKDLDLLYSTIRGERDGYQMEKRYYRRDGSIVWAMLSVSIVRNQVGEPLYFVSQIEDISKRIQYQRNLKEVNKNLEMLTDKLSLKNKSLSDFAHITSHNLRSPIDNIGILIDLYKSEKDDAEKAKILDNLNSTTARLKETFNELIEALIVKEESGLDFETVNVSRTIEKVLSNMQGIIKQSEAEITVEGDENIQVFGNKQYFNSVVQNLISNAIKYAKPEVKPRVQIQFEKKDGQFRMDITDNGVGIDLVKHGKELFGLHKTFHNHADAKGVGLFMVKAQIESMGGKITVQSEPNKGSTFTITI